MTEIIHFRVCHVCGLLNKNRGRKIEKCSSCGKSLVPFFFFDEEQAPPLTDHLLRVNPEMGRYAPLRGLSVVWDLMHEKEKG